MLPMPFAVAASMSAHGRHWRNALVAAFGLVLMAPATAAADPIAFTCSNAHNAAFPIVIDAVEGTAQTATTDYAVLHVAGATAEFFFLHAVQVVQFQFNRYTLTAKDRTFVPSASVLAELRARPRSTADERKALASYISTHVAAAATGDWNHPMSCKQVQAPAF